MEIRSSKDVNIEELKTSEDCHKIIEEITRIINKITLELNKNPNDYTNYSTPYEVWQRKAEKAKREFSALLTALYTKLRHLRKKEKEETQRNGQHKFDQIFKGLVKRELGEKKFTDLIREAEALFRLHDAK